MLAEGHRSAATPVAGGATAASSDSPNNSIMSQNRMSQSTAAGGCDEANAAEGGGSGGGESLDPRSQFGFAGMFNTLRKDFPSFGLEATELGLDLNATVDLARYFGLPWTSEHHSAHDSYTHVPDGYLYPRRQARKSPHDPGLPQCDDEILFYIFYCLPGNYLQGAAALQLTSRGWQYCPRLTRWVMTNNDGKWEVFDPQTWSRRSLDNMDVSPQQQQYHLVDTAVLKSEIEKSLVIFNVQRRTRGGALHHGSGGAVSYHPQQPLQSRGPQQLPPSGGAAAMSHMMSQTPLDANLAELSSHIASAAGQFHHTGTASPQNGGSMRKPMQAMPAVSNFTTGGLLGNSQNHAVAAAAAAAVAAARQQQLLQGQLRAQQSHSSPVPGVLAGAHQDAAGGHQSSQLVSHLVQQQQQLQQQQQQQQQQGGPMYLPSGPPGLPAQHAIPQAHAPSLGSGPMRYPPMGMPNSPPTDASPPGMSQPPGAPHHHSSTSSSNSTQSLSAAVAGSLAAARAASGAGGGGKISPVDLLLHAVENPKLLASLVDALNQQPQQQSSGPSPANLAAAAGGGAPPHAAAPPMRLNSGPPYGANHREVQAPVQMPPHSSLAAVMPAAGYPDRQQQQQHFMPPAMANLGGGVGGNSSMMSPSAAHINLNHMHNSTSASSNIGPQMLSSNNNYSQQQQRFVPPRPNPPLSHHSAE